MGKKMLQFWSLLGGVSLFIFGISNSVVKGSSRGGEFEEVPRAEAFMIVPPVDGEALGGNIPCITKFVQERTQENLEAAVEGVVTFLALAEDQEREFEAAITTQLDTFATIAQKFYKNLSGEGCDETQSIGGLVTLLRSHEKRLSKGFLNLQALYRGCLLQCDEIPEGVFLAEARAVFYFFDNSHRPYLQADQVNWLLNLNKEYDLRGAKFQGYLKRAFNWQRRQEKRKLSSSDESSDGYSSSSSVGEGDVAPKRKWGNKGFQSYAGMSLRAHTYQNKYKSNRKSYRPRSSSW